ncbi:hypothetical protein L1987_69474 [Smallanthus sonchifolius]|uniref:Uncharacterized protein n=1 Tax=Smallanthus sonchifolius TaxID=185202 RepID=A0ACB9B5D9_9ASTR|nr:hypothetical protein L1987_69474 [Smallanthus sonchifolius]
MSYKMISQKTKDGLDVTKHVTRLHAYTRFIDELVPDPPKMKGDDETVREDELDVNATASALRKAIEKAHESVRIAKESVGRKKRGLQSFSNTKFKNSIKVETNVEDVTSSQAFPDFMDGNKLLVAKKVMDEISEKILESTKIETSEFVHEDQTCSMFVECFEGKIEVVKTATDVLNVEEEQEAVERVEVDQLSESNDFNMSQNVEFDDIIDEIDVASHIVDTNEIKESREPQYSDKEDESEEHGPSKVSSQDHFRRIYEEAAAKEKERMKGRLAVERAICEARDRAFVEARERAERQRAAVEEAIEEARQRMMTEACEKVTKGSIASKSSSAQSKLKAERAAVERATSEARQRALKKAMS